MIYPALTSLPDALRDELIAEEQRWLAAGAPAFSVVLVARPKRGLRRWLAEANYWFVPKWKRLTRVWIH